MAVRTSTNLFHSGLHCKWIQSCIIPYNTEQQLLSLINMCQYMCDGMEIYVVSNTFVIVTMPFVHSHTEECK